AQSYPFTVQVTDSAGLMVEGAEVAVDGQVLGSTDAAGKIEVQLADGPHSATATKPGLGSGTWSGTLDHNAAQSFAIPIAGATVFKFTVQVTDPAGEMVDGAEVAVDGQTVGSTDAAGKLDVQLSDGQHSASATKAGLGSGTWSGTLDHNAAQGFAITLNPSPSPGGIIVQGHITDGPRCDEPSRVRSCVFSLFIDRVVSNPGNIPAIVPGATIVVHHISESGETFDGRLGDCVEVKARYDGDLYCTPDDPQWGEYVRSINCGEASSDCKGKIFGHVYEKGTSNILIGALLDISPTCNALVTSDYSGYYEITAPRCGICPSTTYEVHCDLQGYKPLSQTGITDADGNLELDFYLEPAVGGEIIFQGTALEFHEGTLIGAPNYWMVQVDRVAAGPRPCQDPLKVVVSQPTTPPWGTADPDVQPNDAVDVYAAYIQEDSGCRATLAGSASYYFKKAQRSHSGCGRITDYDFGGGQKVLPGQMVRGAMKYRSGMAGETSFEGSLIIRSPSGKEYSGQETQRTPGGRDDEFGYGKGNSMEIIIPDDAEAGWYAARVQLKNLDIDQVCDATPWKEQQFEVIEGSDGSESSGGPDLVVSRLWLSKNPCSPGDDVEVIFDVQNVGDQEAMATVDSLTFDDQVFEFDSSGVATGSVLQPGETRSWETILEDVSPSPSPHKVKASADIRGSISESREDNNEQLQDLAVEGGESSGGPDLVVSRLWLSKNPCSPGDHLEIAFDVQNVGDQDAMATVDCLEIDGSRTDFDSSVIPSSSGSILNPGETRTWKHFFTPGAAGTLAIKATADCNNLLSEKDEGDNGKTAELEVEEGSDGGSSGEEGKPNLVISRLYLSKNPCNLQEDVQIIFQVTNQGAASAMGGIDCLKIDRNEVATFDSSQLPGGGELAPGQSRTWNFNFRPEDPEDDFYRFDVCADCKNQVDESREEDNCKKENLDVVLLKSDLVVETIEFSRDPCLAGDNVDISFRVVNRGDLASGPTVDCLKINNVLVQTFDSSQLPDGGRLMPGQERRWIYTYQSVSGSRDYHRVEACADCQNAVEEKDENNNCDEENLDVETRGDPALADLEIVNLQISKNPCDQGDSVDIVFDVKNTGGRIVDKCTVDLILIDGTEVAELSSTESPSGSWLEPGKSRTWRYRYENVPCDKNPHKIKINVDANGVVRERSERNNYQVVWLKVNCQDHNQAPALESLQADRQSPQEPGSWIKWTATASDPDLDGMFYRFSVKGPATGEAWKDATGWIRANSWTWATGAADEGLNQVKAEVTDDKHSQPDRERGMKTADFEIRAASSANQPPVMESLTADPGSPQEAGTAIKLTARASDPDEDPLKFRIFYRPEDYSSFTEITSGWSEGGEVTWNTAGLSAGTYKLEAWVRDELHKSEEHWDDATVELFTIVALEEGGNDGETGVQVTPNPGESGDTFTWRAAGDNAGLKLYLRGLGDLDGSGSAEIGDVVRIIGIQERGTYDTLEPLARRIADLDCDGDCDKEDSSAVVQIWSMEGYATYPLDCSGGSCTFTRKLFDINGESSSPDYQWKVVDEAGKEIASGGLVVKSP
ncbi:MAG: hypothetical protein GKC10_06715, partial [Methanosarcinales archaeon]|nr:hypothetical protein [Methanosarcinales archaeon]